MVAISETSVFSTEITRTEANDILLGGNENNAPNLALKQLTDRTRWLKTQVDDLLAAVGGLVIGVDVQAFDNDLEALARLSGVGVIEKTGGNSYRTVPVWIPASICEGRLTAQNANPIGSLDSTITNFTLYFLPYNGNRLALYDGSDWVLKEFSIASRSLVGLTANTNYDIFIYENAGILELEPVAWTNNTTRATVLDLQDGVFVKNGAPVRRYLGTVRTTDTTGQIEDSPTKRLVWNYYNPIQKPLRKIYATPYAYNNILRPAGGNISFTDLQFVVGVDTIFRYSIHAKARGGIQFNGALNGAIVSNPRIEPTITDTAADESTYSGDLIVTTPRYNQIWTTEVTTIPSTVQWVQNTVELLC